MRPIARVHRQRPGVHDANRVATSLIPVAATAAALLSHARPTGTIQADVVLTAAFALLASLAGRRARPPALLIFAGAAVAAASPVGAVVAAALAIALAIASAFPASAARPSQCTLLGASVGGLGANSFLHGTDLALGSAVALGIGGTLILAVSAYRNCTLSTRRVARYSAWGVVTFCVIATGAWGYALLGARVDVTDGIDHLQAGIDAARDGDSERAEAELNAAATSLHAARNTISAPWARPVRVLPVVGANARAIDLIAEAADDLSRSAASASDAADVDTFQSDTGRIDLDAVRRAERAVTAVEQAMTIARARLDDARSPWLVAPLAHRLAEAQGELADAAPLVRNAVDAFRAAPVLLGESQPRRYLVLFGTPDEARGRTGFPGNWAELVATKGQVTLSGFGRLRELNQAGLDPVNRKLTGPAEYLARYGRFTPETWHNVAMSPDGPTVADVVAQLYPQSGGAKIDGVLTIDPVGIAALLKMTGPVSVTSFKEPITSANAVDFLTRRQYLELANDDRIDLLAEVGVATFERLLAGAAPGFVAAADELGDAVTGNHITFVAFDDSVRPLLERTGIDGALPPVRGDDIAVITNNAGGNKIDFFLRRALDYRVSWRPDTGDVTATLSINLTNAAPSTGLPDAFLGNAIDRGSPFESLPRPGVNRQWLSVYSAWTPTAATLDGKPVLLQYETELGRRVSSLLIDIDPGAARTLTLTWNGQLPVGGDYTLGFTAQPLVNPDTLALAVTILEKDDATRRTETRVFVLDRDRRIVVNRD